MLLQKDVIRPGIFRKGSTRFLVTKDDVESMSKSIDDLKASGYRVPTWLEHESTKSRKAFPIDMSNQTLVDSVVNDPWFGGWVESGHVDEAGQFHVKLNVPDHLGDRLAKTGTFVSPQFGRWQDDAGREWNYALHHMALTRQPVNENQSNKFRKSGVDQNSDSVAESPVIQMSQLSEAGLEFVQFSMSDAEPEPDAQPSMVPEKTPEEEQAEDAEEAEEARQATNKFRDALASVGIKIDSKLMVTDDPAKLAEMLTDMIQTIGEAADVETEDSDEAGLNGSPDPNRLQEQATVIAMSKTTAPNATETQTPETLQVTPAVPVVDPVQFSQMQQTNQRLTAQVDAMAGMLTRLGQEKQLARVEKLVETGRCTAAEAEGFRNTINAFQFSTGNTDPTQERLAIELDLREKLPPGAMVPQAINRNAVQFSQQFDAVPAGAGSAFFSNPGEVDDSRADAIMDELYAKNPALASVGNVQFRN